MMNKILKWLDHNRFVVLSPLIMVLLWLIAYGCTPLTPSPTDPTRMINVAELQREYELFQVKYEFAIKDLERLEEQRNKILDAITKLASGSIADLPGLLQLLLVGGFFGAVTDNIRKRGLIAGLKRNGT